MGDLFDKKDEKEDKKKENPKKLPFFSGYVPMNPCKCKSLWCFIKAVKAWIKKLYKYYHALSGLPCYLKKQILNKILEFYLRGCPVFVKKLIIKWVNYYINKWC